MYVQHDRMRRLLQTAVGEIFNKGIFIERYRIREIPKKRSAPKC